MTGVVGRSCDRGEGDGSSGSSSRLLRPLKLPSPLAFASQPERGAGGGIGGGSDGGGGGGDARRSRRWLIVLCGDGSDLFRPVASPTYFMGGPFYPPQRTPP